MHLQEFALLGFLTAATTFHVNAPAAEILVRSPNGDDIVFEVDAEERFFEVLDRIGGSMDAGSSRISMDDFPYEREVRIDYMLADLNGKDFAKSDKSITRIYENEISDKERDIITYIVGTLGSGNLLIIGKESFKLKSEGKKIKAVHPLRFLEVIFTDEKLKASMPNIRSSSLIWPDFKNGLFTSLSEEAKKNNLPYTYIQDFAANIGIDPSIIYPSIQNSKWLELVDLLIARIPREGKPGRYNM